MSNVLRSRRLALETLEGRQLMATTALVLDFTPDYRQGTFLDTFYNTKYSNGYAPTFLDFNNDRKITNQDAEIAAGQITNIVRSFFANAASGYNVSVVYNDSTTQTNFGARYLDYGRSSVANQVAVMYVGGRNQGEIGRAPLASNGYNVEGYGQTYSQAIATMLMGRSGMTPAHFAWAVANTAAHELGHMLGLRHSTNYTNDIMNPTQSLTPWNDSFSTQNRYTEGNTTQNATQELRNSFAGQSVQYGNYNGGSRQLGTDGFVDEGSDAGDACDFNLDSFLSNFELHDEHDHGSELASADNAPSSFVGPLAQLNSGAGSSSAASASLKSKGATGAELKVDLLTLLASDLESSQKDASSVSPVKSAASPAELDELFTDFGLVTAN
jgi:hypothetical protein